MGSVEGSSKLPQLMMLAVFYILALNVDMTNWQHCQINAVSLPFEELRICVIVAQGAIEYF